MNRNKTFYDYRGYSGPDGDIETSLRVYGLAWKLISRRKKEYAFTYGIAVNKDGEFIRFDHCTMMEKDFLDLCADSWVELDKVAELYGMQAEDIRNSFPYGVENLTCYYGFEEIFGSSYWEGFAIGKV